MAFSGAALAATRNRAGISREELAFLTSLGFETIRAYEVGRRVPSVGALERLARILQVPVGDLFDSRVAP